MPLTLKNDKDGKFDVICILPQFQNPCKRQDSLLPCRHTPRDPSSTPSMTLPSPHHRPQCVNKISCRLKLLKMAHACPLLSVSIPAYNSSNLHHGLAARLCPLILWTRTCFGQALSAVHRSQGPGQPGTSGRLAEEVASLSESPGNIHPVVQSVTKSPGASCGPCHNHSCSGHRIHPLQHLASSTLTFNDEIVALLSRFPIRFPKLHAEFMMLIAGLNT